MNALILISVLLILMAMRIPVFLSLLLSCLFYLVFIKEVPLVILAHRMMGSLESFPLLALPLFILAADIINYGRTSEEMFKFARALVGHTRGAMGHVVVVASMIFAGISGTITAEAAGLGKLELPMMQKAGFDKPFSVGLVSAASIIGPIIPPSVQMILYAMIAEQSVGRLFVGGVIPGIIMGVCLMVMVYIYSVKRNYPRDPRRASFREILSTLKTSGPALATPAIILGGIMSGVFTPTEAAAVAVAYGLFISVFVYKSLSLKKLPELVKPRQARAIELIRRKTNAKIFYHCCGAASSLIPDFIDLGIDILNPVQVRAHGMEAKGLKERFGDKICFWGGIDSQQVLPTGSPTDVEAEVSHLVQAMAPGGGLVVCAVHNIQADVPPANVLALYDAVARWGTYPLS